MKALVVKVLAIFLACIGLSSCIPVSYAPRAQSNRLVFERSGGTQQNIVTINKWTWDLETSTLTIAIIRDEKGNYTVGRQIEEEELTRKKLPDGSTEIHYDWVTFIVSKDMRLITVKVEENKTGKRRCISFMGPAPVLSLHFLVDQKA